MYLLCLACIDGAEWGGFEPEFIGPMSNVTVPAGRDAVLSCSVANLGGHKVRYSLLFLFSFFKATL